MIDLFNYRRRESSLVHIGALDMGADKPIRIQSMTTTDTNDTEACVAQAERIIKAGGELVRLTTQGIKESENLRNINAGIRADGFSTPLVADVHFNPNVADVAARFTEKVRVNPGNYVDPARKFVKLEYTDEEYAQEIKKIEDRFVPFLNICKEHHTAIRIGVNHGSLSDRIRNRYGDTPEGIVESCMEFLRICKKEQFSDVVISIKASNTVVMVRSMRLLVETMEKEDMHYPLHLGVTEAGEGEDGRIKSAVGIGALLADGIGDTIRVSLSEEPEAEIPVARHLVDYVGRKAGHLMVPGTPYEGFDWLRPERRATTAVGNIGERHVPIVIMSEKKNEDKAETPVKVVTAKPKADYIYVGSELPEKPKEGQKYIVDFNVYAELVDPSASSASREAWSEAIGKSLFPIFPVSAMPFVAMIQAPMKFLVVQFGTPAEEYLACLKTHPEVVVVATSNHQNRLGEQRALVHEMMTAEVNNPVVFAQMYRLSDKEEFQLEAAADMGALMIDGLTDGIWLMNEGNISYDAIEETSFGILQAARLRTTRTEYISCPGCGRTLYDLRETIARIREATADLKGLKIGIMGCIVNGPGEMADADYGYVGAGPKKVSLYRGQVCVERNIPEENAVEHLLKLIHDDKAKA
ncbi:MAG: 4-hydroxy-3-methylbut-2-en-1-yl diphosphate synthase [Prevotella sp.]|nr:4-hydroxy-3-methylbut-2-en-1-yl diphosphate synthase [Prevotella sp.]